MLTTHRGQPRFAVVLYAIHFTYRHEWWCSSQLVLNLAFNLVSAVTRLASAGRTNVSAPTFAYFVSRLSVLGGRYAIQVPAFLVSVHIPTIAEPSPEMAKTFVSVTP